MSVITVAATLAVSNGPQIAVHSTVNVQAYDVISITVPAGATDLAVALQPGAAGKVQLVAITAGAYTPDLSYKVNDAGGTSRALDQAHLLTGAGAVSLLSASAIASLLFSNATAQDAAVQIFVGRDATS